MTARDRCGCGVPLTSLRTWRTLDKERRARHLAERSLAPHHGHGKCQRCYQRDMYVPKPREVVRNCRECQHPVVPNHAPLIEGHRRHFGRGLCSTCYNREKRAGNLDLRPVRVQVEELTKTVGLSLEQAADELGIPLARARRAVR